MCWLHRYGVRVIPVPRRRCGSFRVPLFAAALLLGSAFSSAGDVLAPGGLRLAAASFSNTNLKSVAFGDATHGWAVGYGSSSGTTVPIVYATADGGASWVSQPAPSAFYYWGVAASGPSDAWIVGEPNSSPGGIWATTDGGTTWTPQTVPADVGGVQAVYFSSTTTGWAVGVVASGTDVVLHTSDGGATWIEQALPTSPAPASTSVQCLSVFFLDATHGWLGCRDSSLNTLVVFATTDGGTTWIAHTAGSAPLQVQTETPQADVRFVSATTGFAVSHGVYMTTDGGATWSPVSLPCGVYKGVAFGDALHGWIVGYPCVDLTGPVRAVLFSTSDGGRTWHQDAVPQTAAALFDIAAMSPTNAYAVGLAGLAPYWAPILSTTDGTTWVNYEDRLWMGHVYQNLLGRSPDSGGLNYWLDVLGSGAPLFYVPAAMENTGDYRAVQVTGLYTRFLHRSPDPGGLQAFVNVLASGATDEQVTAALLGSDEYFQTRGGSTDAGWIAAAYADLLNGRSPDAGALVFWEGQLASRSRGSVALAIVMSTESMQDRVNAIYQQLVHSPADPGGLAYWTSAIQSGAVRDERLVTALLTSFGYLRTADQY